MAQLGTIYESKSATAKKIRQALKKAFPEVSARHFSVRCGSGGSDTVRISWTGNPEKKLVDAVVNKFSSASFDGMQDLETVHGYIWEEDGLKYSGAKYIFTDHTKAEEVEEEEVTQEVFEEAVEKASVEEEITLYNQEGDTLGSTNLETFQVNIAKLWNQKYGGNVEFHASINRDGEFMLVAGMGTSRDSMIRKMGINLDTMGILKALGGMSVSIIDSEGRESTVTTDRYKFRGWKNFVFDDVHHPYIPDSIKVLKNGSVVAEFYNVAQFKTFLDDKVREVFAEPGMELDPIVDSGKLGVYPRNEDTKRILSEAGISQSGIKIADTVATANGVLHATGYITQLAGREYGKSGSKGANTPVMRYSKMYEAKIKEFDSNTLYSMLPAEMHYKNADREVIKHAVGLATYKAGFVNAMAGGDTNVADDIIVKAIGEGANLYGKALAQEFREELNSYVQSINQNNDDGVLNGNDFILFLGTDMTGVLKEIEKCKEPNHTRFKQTVFAFLTKTFEAYKKEALEEHQKQQEREAEARKSDPNQMFSDAEIEEADDVKITSEDVVMVRQQVEIVLQQKQFEGYVLSRGELMKLVKVPVMEELKKTNQTDYGNFREAVRNHLADVVDHNFEKIDNLAGHIDPREISTKEMIRVMKDKVVRVHFRKKDGSLRNMVATRNAELIEKLVAVKNGKAYERPKMLDAMGQEDQIQAQISGDYIRVLDVAKGEFRSFKPSTLQRFDSNVNIASWLEFDITDDAWFDTVFNGVSASKYYDYHRNAKQSGVRLEERKAFELKAQAILHPEAQVGQAEQPRTRESKAETCKQWANQYLASIKDTQFDDNYENLYKSLGTVVNGINKQPAISQKGWVAKVVQDNATMRLRVIQVSNEAFMVHPHFLVNIVSGKVYIDKTDTLRLGHPNPSEVDAILEPFLTKVADVIRGVRRSTRQNAPANEADVKRMNRMKQFAELQKDTIQQSGVRMDFAKSNGKELSVFKFGTYVMFVAPSEIVVKQGNNEPKQLFKRVRHTSTLTEMSAVLDKTKLGSNPNEQKQFEFVKQVIYTTYDLRKQLA
ncbi:LPD29 domain-containing protein [Bacillus thuringiensis]|uniref:LPD29 domain-containing protein n=1 Tax=Bacillus thuringiensis TaxID=1428 RepID=UPI000BFDA483|nr:LPD29 domain-containing protein [Bacillus thuringiensis]PGT89967.1 hypothetical protein COD17_09465 [Bacillus thuringiensis]